MKMNGILRKVIMMALPFLIKKGTDYVAKRGTTTTTAGSKQLQSSARSTAKRARQAAKVTRKMR